jgi:superfamily II DNA/RNA helicase
MHHHDSTASSFSKYQRLLTHLRSADFGWQKTDAGDRLVIFSERIETLRWLQKQLGEDLKLKASQIERAARQMTDTEQQDLVERFGRLDDPLRVLLCSDVASEGLNLHYFCHRLVHFDMPWSLMVFQQRNGRVDRYGQKAPAENRLPVHRNRRSRRSRATCAFWKSWKRKDEQANKNLGDPSAFLNVFDADKEAEKVAAFMADGLTPDQVETTLDATAASDDDNEADAMMKLLRCELAGKL